MSEIRLTNEEIEKRINNAYLDGQRIRLRVCEGCGSKFRTVELMIEDVNRLFGGKEEA